MKPVKNRFHLDFPVSLQEEFVDVVTQTMDNGKNMVNGLSSTVCIAVVMARVESLRGRISAFEPRESTRQALGLFESLLAEMLNG